MTDKNIQELNTSFCFKRDENGVWRDDEGNVVFQNDSKIDRVDELLTKLMANNASWAINT
jgi:hypothetical protein